MPAATSRSSSKEQGISTRTVWTGNIARQPLMKNARFRQPAGGLPNADRVMESGMLLTMNDRLMMTMFAISAIASSRFCGSAVQVLRLRVYDISGMRTRVTADKGADKE